MNFNDAIQAHAAWKMKLTAYIRNPDKTLSASDAGDEHKCQLGAWLATEGKTKCGGKPQFKALVDAHHAFHRAAADIIHRADAGENVSADIALGAGSPYAKASQAIVAALMEIKNICK